MTKKIVVRLFIFLAIFQAGVLYAAQQLTLEDFDRSRGLDASLVNVEGNTFAKAAWHPDFKWSGFELGLDLNVYIPFDSEAPYPNDLEFLVLRHVGYTYKDRAGFKWGHLRNVNFGQGMLMSGYDSGAGRSGIFNTRKAGFLGFVTLEDYRLDALYTATNVQGARLSGPIPKLSLMGVSFYAGATYIQDSDGVEYVESGQTISRPAQDGYELDVYWPIGGMFLTVYGAYSELSNRLDKVNGIDGNGGSVGVRGDMMGLLYYKAAYVRLGEGFVPNYFNSTYEVTSISKEDILTEAVDGYLAGLGTNFGGSRFKLGVEYERYGDRNLMTANAGWVDLGPISGVINYTVPFQGSKNRIAQADIVYQTGRGLTYNFNIRRAYTDNNNYIETYGVSTTIDLKKFF
jgi:hypothetical protein